jgi:hypothetical protein
VTDPAALRGAAHLSFALMVVVLGYAGHQRRRGGLDTAMRVGLVANLLGTTVLWLRANKVIEGPVLLVVATKHGLTLADLLGIPSAALALLLLREELVGQRVSARLNRR